MSTKDSPSVAPANGWWAVYRRDDLTTFRVRVAVWFTEHVDTHDADYVAIRAMVVGDRDELVPADSGDSNFSYLWHDGDSSCICGRVPLDPERTDDTLWCPVCSGVIRP